MDESFGKNYKLCHQGQIDSLYKNAKGSKVYPYIYKIQEVEFSDKTTFKSVIATPKKIHKSAVDRNKIKRLTREALRLNKKIIEDYLTKEGKQIALFFIYTSKDVLSFELINKKMVLVLNAVKDQLEKTK
jgi:ribonuclease P protein component